MCLCMSVCVCVGGVLFMSSSILSTNFTAKSQTIDLIVILSIYKR